jgi:hypothetical protein
MNTYSTLNLGNFPANTSSIALSGITFPYTGNYTVQSLINGVWKNTTLAGVSGNAISIVNNYPDDATVMFRIKLPSGDQTNNNSYINDANGHIWFQFTNIPL